MAKKTVVVSEVRRAPPVADLVEVSENELEELISETSIEEKLREWAARENPECLIVKTYVYKYDNALTGDQKCLCDRIDNEIPDPHQIGIAFGAGRYMMVVDIPRGESQQKKVKGLRFRLHQRYDDLKKAAAPGLNGAAVPVASANSSISDGIAMFRSVVEVLRPLLESRGSPVPAASPDVSRLLEGQYDMMSSVLKKSLENGQELIAEVHKAKLEGIPQQQESEEPDFLTKAMPLIQQFLPLILNGGGAGAATAATIRAIPEVRKVIGDRSALLRVVSWLDKSQGKEKTDRVLSALKVRRPAVNGRSVTRSVKPVAAVG